MMTGRAVSSAGGPARYPPGQAAGAARCARVFSVPNTCHAPTQEAAAQKAALEALHTQQLAELQARHDHHSQAATKSLQEAGAALRALEEERQALQKRFEARPSRVEDVERCSDLTAQLQTAQQRADRLQRELLARESAYTRTFVGGAGQALSVPRALKTKKELLSWVLPHASD